VSTVGRRPHPPLWRRRRWLLAVVLLVAAVTGALVAALPDPQRAPRFRPPDGAVYLGVSTDYARLPAFATASGRARPALYGRWTTPGGTGRRPPAPTGLLTDPPVRDHSRSPLSPEPDMVDVASRPVTLTGDLAAGSAAPPDPSSWGAPVGPVRR